ncbi:helix-turn-helix transcriptional regulator [Streptomyces sp. SID10815]|uniref:helix-turn-helix domain-containing protein n=1 Tax=Streptomyces sp. SID10815 TaxID=2706027 RepID=UPI0031BA1668
MPDDVIDDGWIDREAARIGTRIRTVREYRGLTQETVFLAVPMNRAHYQEIEAGRANPTLRTLIRIARAIGVDLSELVT